MRHVLVIGGAGYVGSGLVPELLNRGDKVRVLDNLLYENAASIAHLSDRPDFSFMRGDFTASKVCEEALEDITDVVLLAALVGDPICKKYPDLARKTNLEGPKQLFDLLRNRPINRFIFTSTCSNYGFRADDSPATEESELNPVSLYAETKVGFEKYILENFALAKFCPVILRLSTAYGIAPRMRFDLTISEFTKTLAAGEKLIVFDENTWRPYCHVADISKAIVLALDSPADRVRGEVFNVGSSAGNCTKKMIVDVVAGKIKGAEITYKEGGTDPRNYRVDFDKIRRVLQFKPDYTIEQNVSALVKAIQNGFFHDYESRRNFYGNYEIKN
jgi:nucleoside-diphosphate-sugar epimerase